MSIVQIQEVYDEAGVWGFWRGVFPTLIMVCKKLLLHIPQGGHSLFSLFLTGQQSIHTIYALRNFLEEAEESPCIKQESG